MKELIQLNKPYFHIMFAEKNEFIKFYCRINSKINEDIILKQIDGNKCTTVEGLFNEFSRAFQFPDYFGSNWGAFDECLNDLDWLPGKAYILFIIDADKITETSDNSFENLIKLLERSVNEWTEGRNYDDFPSPPTPFHVVFQCSSVKRNEMELRFEITGLKNINVLNVTD
jgi:RNAse (barnase) inhibitor barstar